MGWACIAQAIFLYNLTEETIFYTYKFFNLITWPFGFVNAPVQEYVELNELQLTYQTMKSYIISNRIQRVLMLNLDLMLNSLVFIDLSWTLGNPFYPREKRKPLFGTFVSVFMVTNLIYLIGHYSGENGDLVELDLRPLSSDTLSINYYFHILVVLYVIWCFFKVSYRLAQPGTSRQLRNRVITRHISFMLIYLVHFLPNILLYDVNKSSPHLFEISILHWFHGNTDKLETVYLFSYIAGFCLALIRITEPMIF